MTLEETEALTSTGADGEMQSGTRAAVVRVRSNDGVEYELAVEAAMASGLLREALEKRGDDEGAYSAFPSPSVAENQPPIEVQRVGHHVLEKVVAFLTHHATEPMGKIPNDMTATTTFEKMVPIQWCRDFCSEGSGMTIDVLSEVLRAAHYMDVEPLIDLACAKFATIMHGTDIDEVREAAWLAILGLEEMTSEELSASQEEHPWFFSS